MRSKFQPWNEVPKSPINSFDIDGVIYMGEHHDGIYPGPNDIIVTGRGEYSRNQTEYMLNAKGINNPLYMNNKPQGFNDRRQSGLSKVMQFVILEKLGYRINIHFDDDPVQIKEINNAMPHILCVHISHDLIPKE